MTRARAPILDMTGAVIPAEQRAPASSGAFSFSQFLEAGDAVTLGIEKLGEQKQKIVAEKY